MPVLTGVPPQIPIPEEDVYTFIFKDVHHFQDRVALVDGITGQEWTFSQYVDEIRRLACGLRARGVCKGTVLAIYSPNSVQYVLLFFATQRLGAVITLANGSYTARELRHQLVDAGAEWVFTPTQSAPTLEEALDGMPANKVKEIIIIGKDYGGYTTFEELLRTPSYQLPPAPVNPSNDTAVIPYSSGTTGLPKGVEITHKNIVASIVMWDQFGLDESAVLAYLPMFHIYGLLLVLNSARRGKKLVVIPRFLPDLFCGAMETHKVATLFSVPPICLFLVNSPLPRQYDLSSMTFVICGAAPMGEDTELTLKKQYNTVISQGWGMTETTGVGTLPIRGQKGGSVGKVFGGSEIKIVDADSGRTLQPGEPGELWVRGPHVMKGYLGNPAATRQVLTHDGWLKTGDLGYYDEEGYIYITDRLKELIKYKGFQVAPAELEHLLVSHPEVADAAVIGVPDGQAGELPKAFVVRRPPASVTAQDLHHFVQENTTSHKWLRGGIEFVDTLPKSASGKILRKELRKLNSKAKL